MKRKTKILQTMSAITLSFCFYACTDDTVGNSPNYQQSLIDNMITDFYHSTSPQTRNSGNGSLRISKIDTMTYILTNDTVLSKKELNTEAYIDSFKIETVTFNIGQQTGYAIVSDDSRLERVYYFTDNGLLNDTSEIWPLKQYIDSIPLNAYQDIINKKVANKTRATTLEILPIVQTSWGQG